jgi:hypothetical protein
VQERRRPGLAEQAGPEGGSGGRAGPAGAGPRLTGRVSRGERRDWAGRCGPLGARRAARVPARGAVPAPSPGGPVPARGAVPGPARTRRRADLAGGSGFWGGSQRPSGAQLVRHSGACDELTQR